MSNLLKTAFLYLASLVSAGNYDIALTPKSHVDNQQQHAAQDPLTLVEDPAPIPIYASDVNPAGKILSTPGTYQLAENIIFNPEKPGLAAITIDAANITLLLNNFTLSQTGTVAPTDGILINGQVGAIIQGNGIITGFSGNGIHATAGTSSVLLKHLISTANIGPSGNGAYFEHSFELSFNDCNFQENDQSGLTFLDCNLILFEHCSSDNNGATSKQKEDHCSEQFSSFRYRHHQGW